MTDTNYNDGKWHGWNGGECPVHPKTRVKAIEESTLTWEAEAGDCDWPSFRGCFRVTKEHKEPREFWISNNDGFAHDSLESVLSDPLTEKHGYIHVREVIGDDASKPYEWDGPIRRGPGSGPMGSGNDGNPYKTCSECGGIEPTLGSKGDFRSEAIGHKPTCSRYKSGYDT